MNIIRIAVLSDNYIFVLHDPESQQAAVVDPALAQPVLNCLNELQANLVAIFNTHHHSDHVGGNQKLISAFPSAIVYGGKEDKGRIPHQQVYLEEGDQVRFVGRKADVFFVPGHTKAHIAYYFPPTATETTGELFCGDTLFGGGCGRLFEGTPTQMVDSLSKFRNLPENTRVWCAHEYTLSNLKFAITIEKDNLDLKNRYNQVQNAREQNIPTIPSSIGLEKLTNPFLRWDQPSVKSAMNLQESNRVFARLRGMKDNF